MKPIVISLLHIGFKNSEALEILEAMGVTNPNSKGNPYDVQTLTRLLKDRLWGEGIGKTWTVLRDIFLEPVVENLIRKQIPQEEIDKLVGQKKGWTHHFITTRWSFNSHKEAMIFFNSNYLGYHKVDDYLD